MLAHLEFDGSSNTTEESCCSLWERNVVPFLSDVGFLGLHVFRSGLQQVSPAPGLFYYEAVLLE